MPFPTSQICQLSPFWSFGFEAILVNCRIVKKWCMNGPGSAAVARGLDLLAIITKREERSLANVFLALELVFLLLLLLLLHVPFFLRERTHNANSSVLQCCIVGVLLLLIMKTKHFHVNILLEFNQHVGGEI